MGKMFIATEAIDFQDTVFGKELEAVFKAIYDTCENIADIYNGNYHNLIRDIVKNHTNINISELQFVEFGDFAVAKPRVSASNILIRNSFEKAGFSLNQSYNNAILELAKKYKNKNYVDLKNAKVHGIFSELGAIVEIGAGFLLGKEKSARNKYFNDTKSDYTPAEITAIFLHEIGHVFTSYEYLSRTITTNQVIAGLVTSVYGQEVKKPKFDFKLASELINVDSKELEKVSEAKTPDAVAIVVLDLINDNKSDMMATPYYSKTANEQLADQFTARMGYGKELVTAFSKVSKKSRWDVQFIETYEAYAPLATRVCALAFGFMGFWPISIMVYSFYFLYNQLIVNTRLPFDLHYDDTKTRFQRLREQYIEKLKNSNLKAEDIRVVLNAIDEMSTVIDKRKDVFKGFWYFVNKRIPGRRKKLNMIELNRDLEELGANELFVQAAIFKTLFNQ